MKEKKHGFRTFLFILLLIFILIFLYGRFFEPNTILVNEYEIKNKNIPNSFNNFKIAHFSDILYKDNDDLERLKDVREKINDKKVDMVIFSGDLIKKDSNVRPSLSCSAFIIDSSLSPTTNTGLIGIPMTVRIASAIMSL